MTAKTKRKSIGHPFNEDGQVIESKPAVETVSPVELNPPPWPWLTIETLLYGLIFILGFSLRWWHLDLYPLADAEAAQGLAALQLYRGSPIESEAYSPLLLSLNSLAFLLFGVSDATARLAAVLLGSLMIVLPVTLRRQLGRRVCLLTTALLALSPTALFLSRTLNSEVGLAAGTFMVLAGFFNWAEDGRQRWLFFAAAGLAVALTAGPMAYSVLLVFSVIVLLKFSTFKALWLNGLDQARVKEALSSQEFFDSGHMPAQSRRPAAAEGSQEVGRVSALTGNMPGAGVQEAKTEIPASVLALEANSEDGQVSTQPLPAQPYPSFLRYAGLFFLIMLVILATAATFNLPGLSMLSGFLPDWLSRFSWQARPNAGFNAVFLLTIYEPLLVLAGLAGLAYAILEKDGLKQTLAGWFAGLLILDAVMIGRPTGHVILALIPLAFLAALALTELWHGVEQEGSWGNEGLLLVAGLVIASFSYIGLTDWLVRTCGPDETICQYVWLQPVAAISMFLIIALFFAFMTNAGVAARGAALVGVALGLVAAVSIGWRLNYGPLMDLAYQPLAGIPVSTELVAVTDTLAAESAQRTGGEKTALDTTLAGVNSPALLWRLRDFDKLTRVGSVAEAPLTTAIITPAETELALGEPYLGQDFALDAIWSPVGLAPKDLVNWLIYRRVTAVQPQGHHAVLWLRADQN